MLRISAALLTAMMTVASVAGQTPGSDELVDRVTRLSRASSWKRVASIPVGFRTFHPQGMVKVGDVFFVSSVEVTTPTERYPTPTEGFDRSPGEGVGHLFKMDAQGKLIAGVRLGEGSIYHPGGIDFDGTHIWVPVAEYRPDSRSIIYRVDPATLEVTEVLRFADHVGGVVNDAASRTLHGISWGSRRFYRWEFRRDGSVVDAEQSREQRGVSSRSHYIDYQDCQFLNHWRMLCTGVADIRQPDGPAVRLGGLEIVSLEEALPMFQVPVPLWTKGGRPMTQNPSWFEPAPAGLRAYFMPDDDESVLYVYDVE